MSGKNTNNNNSSNTGNNNGKKSAERDEQGNEFLASTPWKKMNTTTSTSSKASEYFDKLVSKVTGNLEGDDLLRVLWLSTTLFFIVGGYWLLRSLKDPIMSVINGVSSDYFSRLVYNLLIFF